MSIFRRNNGLNFSKNNINLFEFSSDLVWLNSGALSISDFRGRVVLFFFFSFADPVSLRFVDFVNELVLKYGDDGFVVVGVCSPEFEFEKSLEGLARVVDERGVKIPVIMDSSLNVFEMFGGHWKPWFVVVDSSGFIVFDAVSTFVGVEAKVVGELRKSGVQGLSGVGDEFEVFECELGRDVYFGYGRGLVLNHDELEKDVLVDYSPVRYRGDAWLEGKWIVGSEYIESYGGWLHIPFDGSRLDLVVGGSGNVRVVLDDRALERCDAGNSVVFRDDESYLEVEIGESCGVLNMDRVVDGVLSVYCSEGIRLYKSVVC